MAKKTFLLSILCVFCMLASAQETNGYYFKEFTNGQVILKNKQFARGKFNYDFVNHQMHFLNGNTDMIVENLQDIDTIIIDKTRFIPCEGRFMEVMKGKNAVVLIEKEVNTREEGNGTRHGVGGCLPTVPNRGQRNSASFSIPHPRLCFVPLPILYLPPIEAAGKEGFHPLLCRRWNVSPLRL